MRLKNSFFQKYKTRNKTNKISNETKEKKPTKAMVATIPHETFGEREGFSSEELNVENKNKYIKGTSPTSTLWGMRNIFKSGTLEMTGAKKGGGIIKTKHDKSTR